MKNLFLSKKHEKIERGYSGVEVYYLPDLSAYLKIGKIAKNSNLRWERNALDWLAGKFAVPAVLSFEIDENIESILLSEIPGIPASDFVASGRATSSSVEDFMKIAGSIIRRLHDISIDDCPLDQRLNAKFEKARENVEKGFVDEADFDKESFGKSAEQVYAELCNERPDHEDVVFTHGDLCLPNIILSNNEIAGFIDLDRAGVADRYQDIALFLRSFEGNSAPRIDFEKAFCKAYGIEKLDREQLDFYRKMDELF